MPNAAINFDDWRKKHETKIWCLRIKVMRAALFPFLSELLKTNPVHKVFLKEQSIQVTHLKALTYPTDLPKIS